MSSTSPIQATSSTSSIRPRRPTRTIPAPPLNHTDPLPDLSSLLIDGDDLEIPLVHTLVSEDTPFHDREQDEAYELTPLRAHYLKKSLIQLQINYELDAITSSVPNNVSTFSYLGPPFSPPPKDAPSLDLPFLRYFFRQFVLTFPFMASAPKDFYSDKLQPFMASVLSRNLSPTSVFEDSVDGSDQATRLKLLSKLERNLSLFIGAATKLVEREEVVRLNQNDLDRLEELSKKRQAKMLKTKDIFEVNIVGVRTVVDKGRMRSRVHEEFLIRTRRSHHSDHFVSRRYGDFKTLANELRKAHPNESIRSPPVKDRTTVSVSTPSSAPPFAQTNFSRQQAAPGGQYNSSVDSLNSPSTASFQSQTTVPSKLAREKNRLTLRSYLHSLMSSSTIASSPVLKSFLLASPTSLSLEELEDAKRREEADKVREDGRKRFAKEIASRVDGLRDAIKDVKGDVMGKDGLTHVFGTIKVTPNVRDLPSNYQDVLEWARISLASTVFHQFVAADNASETFAGLKRIHGLMPYFMLRTALKVSNPIGMIRSVLDLFLAQPFGGRSLLQRMFTSSMTEEVKVLEEEIEAVKDKVDDAVMCEKIRQFVYAPKEIQDLLKADAALEHLNLLTVVLRSADEPVLTRVQMHRVARAHRAHAIYVRERKNQVDSDDDDGPQDDDAWLYEDLKVLAHLYSRLRDKEQLIALIFEGFTAELLKDIITIFYTPLAQVYKAASIADSLSDLQNFINDLIKTVDQVEELSQVDPHRTVQTFIDLIQRHEQAFYSFVHKVHSKGEGLFDSLMRWIELFLTLVREGLGDPISLEFLLPHTGQQRKDILQEVDAVALYHYKLKVIYEDKLRRRFGKTQGTDADAQDEATQALVNGVVGEISFGELVQGDADDIAAEETDDESGDESSSEFETDTDEDEDDEDDEEESDGSSQQRRRPARSLTTLIAAPAAPSPPRSRPESRTPIAPKRSLSLRSLRSSKSFTHSPKHSHDFVPPPVPPLPKNAYIAALSKPLPPSPSPRSSNEHMPPPPPPKRREPPPLQSTRKSKKTSEVLKPPDLKHLPELLPVFTEMMRPLLRPRQRTNPS